MKGGSNAHRLRAVEHIDQEAGYQAQIKTLNAAGCDEIFAEDPSRRGLN
jgi:hypothetical protein